MNIDQVFGWLDQHNGTVTAIATAVLALVTIALAILNQRLLKASTKATEAAQRAAKAGEDEAKASREAMELDWRPVLTFHHATETTELSEAATMTSDTTYVRNEPSLIGSWPESMGSTHLLKIFERA
jgi:hypothetical protein